MRIDFQKLNAYTIHGAGDLEEITVYVNECKSEVNRILIEYAGLSWVRYWIAKEGETHLQFLASCREEFFHPHLYMATKKPQRGRFKYLLEKLDAENEKPDVIDVDPNNIFYEFTTSWWKRKLWREKIAGKTADQITKAIKGAFELKLEYHGPGQ